jgi:hypothetical protein
LVKALTWDVLSLPFQTVEATEKPHFAEPVGLKETQ